MNTYTEAMAELKRNKRNNCENIVRWDAGDGHIGMGHWCSWRKRIVTWVCTADGFNII